MPLPPHLRRAGAKSALQPPPSRFSPHSEEALRKAVELAQAGEEVHLTILSVAPPPSTFIASGPAYTAVSVEGFQEEIDRSWDSQLDQALATVPDDVRGRVDTKLTHGPGSPGPSIAEEASAGDYDLLMSAREEIPR